MKTKKPRAPRFTITAICVWLTILVFGTFAAAGWWVRFSDVSVPLAGMMVVVALAAATISPAMVPVFEQARGLAKLAALAVVATFGAIDAAGGHNAFVTFEKIAQANEISTRTAEVSAQVEVATAALSAAQLRIDNLPSAEEVCQGVGPQGCTVRLAAQAEVRQGLVADRDTAQGRLDAIDTSVYVAPIIDHTALLVGMVMIQVSLVIAILSMAATTRRREAELEAAAAAAKEATAAKRAAAEAAKAKAAKGKSKAPALRPCYPHLVASNDR